MIEPNEYPPYPKCYLHVRDCKTGQEWIRPITGKQTCCLRTRLKQWCKEEFGGELKLDGEIMPRLEGDYYAQIKLDGRAPDDVHCWTSGGFYLKTTY